MRLADRVDVDDRDTELDGLIVDVTFALLVPLDV